MDGICLGLGANLGNPENQLRQAVLAWRRHEGVRVRAVSSLYRSQPWGVADQPEYLNAALRVESQLSPREILEIGQALERQAGRVRRELNAARELDIDLLLYHDTILDEAGLRVPHPRMAERAFVLWPLAEIAPQAFHPRLGQTVMELAARVSGAGVQKLPGGAAWADANKE